eukprot:TRINITY_DN3268_c0_g1_i2.p1 TRINITY_DN3268_c0_g1~~TRINITY_DN3268_c0_g1_i2.p1  ORF type:complete len:1260 (-),score=340.89 TRINITY_DN3268_c0_g1_i2:152-3931(-)
MSSSDLSASPPMVESNPDMHSVFKNMTDCAFIESRPFNWEDLRLKLGYGIKGAKMERTQRDLKRYIEIKLAAHGHQRQSSENLHFIGGLLENWFSRSKDIQPLPPIGMRIQDWVNQYLEDVQDKMKTNVKMPTNVLELDRYGMSRILSVSNVTDEWNSEHIDSYRLFQQGVLHNPQNDRRTTKNVFHVVDGGLPKADDKILVPKEAFGKMLHAAFNPPTDLFQLPYDPSVDNLFAAILCRVPVTPGVEGKLDARSMEIRFMCPCGLMASLDFVESIFGNGGDPFNSSNDAARDINGWSGHTGFVILAPHCRDLKKKDLGLPHISEATEYQKSVGMCWEHEDEKYHNGQPFKLTARDEKGVVVTIIADNYFGYAKKEIKTMISYACNLSGVSEEEHAGGALCIPRYGLGYDFDLQTFVDKGKIPDNGLNFDDVCRLLAGQCIVHPEGYATDIRHKDIIYLPRRAVFSVLEQKITWTRPDGKPTELKLLERVTYILPTGYKVHLSSEPSWHLVGTASEGVVAHKPCTVSGGGKSELSKPLTNAIIRKPFYVQNFEHDFDMVYSIVNHDFNNRFLPGRPAEDTRQFLDPQRSLGSVIKLLTVSPGLFSDSYNRWLSKIPDHVTSLAILLKHLYDTEMGDDWRKEFSVDMINGMPGHELKFKNRTIHANYARVGFAPHTNNWRTFKTRQDFEPAKKIQLEDDISVSATIPTHWIKDQVADDLRDPETNHHSVKMLKNVEYRFFQRADEAIHRGFDFEAERDLAGYGPGGENVFFANYEPLTLEDAITTMENGMAYHEYTKNMQKRIKNVAEVAVSRTNQDFMDSSRSRSFEDQERQKEILDIDIDRYWASSDRPRMVDGKPSKNPRYLQERIDLLDDRDRYIAEMGARIGRNVPLNEPVYFPVDSILFGRRNNPADLPNKIRPLAVFNPLHYQELPEACMDWMACLTGKSPSTTGAGSEGCLTKAPFNNLQYSADLNNFFLSCALSGYDAFSSAAGYIGDNYEVSHDISLLVPEIWSRLLPKERSAKYLIDNGFMERVDDFPYKGRNIKGSRLGWRINSHFLKQFLGRLFDTPDIVFNDVLLRPEEQGLPSYVDGIENICEAHLKVAQAYIRDGTVDLLVPPLRILVHMMVSDDESFGGYQLHDSEYRELFSRESILESDWYSRRLKFYQITEVNLLLKKIKYLANLANQRCTDSLVESLNYALVKLSGIVTDEFIVDNRGTIGADYSYTSLSEEEIDEYTFDNDVESAINAVKNIDGVIIPF